MTRFSRAIRLNSWAPATKMGGRIYLLTYGMDFGDAFRFTAGEAHEPLEGEMWWRR